MKTDVAKIQSDIEKTLQKRFMSLGQVNKNKGKNKIMGRKWGNKRQGVAR